MDSAIITGRNSVIEALKAGRSVTRIYITAGKDSQPLLRIRSMAREKGVPVEPVSPDVKRPLRMSSPLPRLSPLPTWTRC